MSSGNAESIFAAVDSAVGYLYQCRVALLWALRRLRLDQSFRLSLETLDDVTFERDGSPPALLQTKHHRAGSANLSDASPDLWKTIRIWSEGLVSGSISTDASLVILTTSLASVGSAAAYLRPEGRDVPMALEHLLATARASANNALKPAYAAFKALTPEQQRALVEAMTVCDAAPSIVDLDRELRGEVRWAAGRCHVEALVARLDSWWLRRAVQHLAGPTRSPVTSDEIEEAIDGLREAFKRDSLPIDEDILAVQVDGSVYQNAPFVQQLKLINAGARSVLLAIRDYFRAVDHRSRWTREDLLLGWELGRYERKLVEEWELVFERMKDDLGEEAAEAAKVSAAKAVYKWVETAIIPIRPAVTDGFVSRGSFHILSDRLAVGWHPDFLDRLQHLLERPEAVA